MDYNHTRSGNAISKTARIQGAQFIVNQGLSVIGPGTEIHGERNNGRPAISWGKYVVLDAGAVIRPAEVNEDATGRELAAAGSKEATPEPGRRYVPLRIGHHVYIGPGSVVEASTIGSHVIIGKNCQIGARAVVRNCSVVPDNSVVPPQAVVGPLTRFTPGSRYGGVAELPESAEEAIGWYCEMRFRGVDVAMPF